MISGETGGIPLPLAGSAISRGLGWVRGGLATLEQSMGISPPFIPPASGGKIPAAIVAPHFQILILLLLLTSCAQPQTIFKPVEVDRPVAISCTHHDIEKPDAALSKTTPQASLFDKTKAALIELDNRKTYEAQLEAALSACP